MLHHKSRLGCNNLYSLLTARTPMAALPNSIDETMALLARDDYVADRSLGTSV